MTHYTDPDYDQDSFRGRTNVTDPTGVNTAFDGGDAAANDNWTQEIDTLFRIRFLIQQTNTGADSAANLATEFALQYQVNGGGWNDVAAQAATSDAVRYADGDFADGDDTTQILGGGTFVTGDGVEITPSDTITFTVEAATETELEFALEIYSGQISANDTVELRLLYSVDDESPPATVLEAYTNTPSLTASVGAQTHGQTIVETLTLTDSISISKTGQIHGQTITETLTLTDTINLNLITGKFVSETLTFIDEISINSILNISQEDNLFLSDIINIHGILTRGKSITENISLTDEITISKEEEVTHPLSLSDTLNIEDIIYKSVIHYLSLSDSINLSDSLTKTTILNRHFSETLNLLDEVQIHGILTHNQSFSDTLNLSDISNITGILNRSYSNTITLTDDLSIASYTPVELGLNINEILNLTDTINAEKYIEPEKPKPGSMLMFGGRFRETKIARAFH